MEKLSQLFNFLLKSYFQNNHIIRLYIILYLLLVSIYHLNWLLLFFFVFIIILFEAIKWFIEYTIKKSNLI